MQHEKNIGFNVRRLTNYIKRDMEKSSASGKIILPKGVHGWVFYQTFNRK